MELIDGNLISKTIIEELTTEVSKLQGPQPTIAFIRVGDDPASVSYVNKKQKTAAQIGIKSELVLLPENITQEELFAHIDGLNKNPAVHGILVQAPLPKHMSQTAVFNRVAPEKDVDGFSSSNLGKLCQEDPDAFVACTPAGIVELLKRTGTKTSGKHVVVLGRSLIVGKPMALLMLQKADAGNATVTVCHSKTAELAEILPQADIVIAAMGLPRFVKSNMIKSGAVVIDVGINRIPDETRKSGYRLVGDVDFDEVSPKTSKITPVPGGVGPMTVAMLMSNTLKAYNIQLRNNEQPQKKTQASK